MNSNVPHKHTTIPRQAVRDVGAARPPSSKMQDAFERTLSAEYNRMLSQSVDANGNCVPTGPAHIQARLRQRTLDALDLTERIDFGPGPALK